MNELALFAGAGGGILGGRLLGFTTVCAIEIEPYCIGVLLQRQNDGILPPFPVWDDVRTFNGFPWRGIVDVVSGGFPCQDISVAGRGEGISGEHSGLWKEYKRIICEVRPKFAFVENSPALTARGLDVVLGDLAEIGHNAEWGVLGAADVGANHKRDRMWIIAYSMQFGSQREWKEQYHAGQAGLFCGETGRREDWWTTEPDMGRVAHGVAARVDRLKAIGNGQVPLCMAVAFQKLFKRIQKRLFYA